MLKPVKNENTKAIPIAFDNQTLTLKLDQLARIKVINDTTKASKKYKQILTSIRAVGIIEPPVVSPDPQAKGRYILLDGHLRVEALKDIGETETICLIAKDDESFTYNKHVSRLSPIQEHKMIVNAVKRGVPEKKIAEALDVDMNSIIRKRDLLDGVCSEAADILKDKMTAARIFDVLKQMLPVRQIEAASLMTDSEIYTFAYAKALLAATPKSQLVNPKRPKKIKGLTEEQMERMENEMATLQRDYRLIEESYSGDVLLLTLARGYVSGLLENTKVVKYLAQGHPEVLSQFQKISEMTTLGSADARPS